MTGVVLHLCGACYKIQNLNLSCNVLLHDMSNVENNSPPELSASPHMSQKKPVLVILTTLLKTLSVNQSIINRSIKQALLIY